MWLGSGRIRTWLRSGNDVTVRLQQRAALSPGKGGSGDGGEDRTEQRRLVMAVTVESVDGETPFTIMNTMYNCLEVFELV
ncbi:hypothetical protein M0R45_035760 [Rubus argutus]|uniref:Uncharacterized protein n=1 Tax=Rubus argutus TaxID=59490 RepID=A0AAW1VWP7_RUBAR